MQYLGRVHLASDTFKACALRRHTEALTGAYTCTWLYLQQYNVRRRIRNSADHVQRMWPVWSKKLDAFSQTWYGKVTILTVIFVIISSPIFWQLLNLLLLAW